MQFYHDSTTDKSFRFLSELKKRYRFVLIGGWAVFLYTHSLKSKDIDIVLDYDELGRLREEFIANKNDRLKKYEIKTGEFDVDIYVAHYSDLGLPAEKIREAAVARDGFLAPPLEMLLLLKLYAWRDRRGTVKGRKDELDILSLAFLPEFDWRRYKAMVKEFTFVAYGENLTTLLTAVKSVPELKLNDMRTSRLKKRIIAELSREN
ncbi:MAG: hypothetical protein AAB897_02270 [Patescibacteria group bacterium]